METHTRREGRYVKENRDVRDVRERVTKRRRRRTGTGTKGQGKD